MAFGITITLLTMIAIALAFLPALLSSRSGENADERAEFEHDLTVYKDQLKEIDRELQRNTINAADADQAKTEIARRILAAEAKINEIVIPGEVKAKQRFGSISIAAIALIFVPSIAALTYASLGSPSMEAQPLQPRILAAQNRQQAENEEAGQLQLLVERAETHLKNNPEDGRGWDVLAPIYFRMGEGEKARDAYSKAIALLGESAQRLSGLGEVEVALAGGLVNDAAKSRFESAALLDSNDGRSQFYLGLSEAQAGNVPQAIEIWQSVALNQTISAEWRSITQRQLAALAPSQNNAPALAPAIDQETIDQMRDMSVEDRQIMIEGMVAQLDARLSEQGGSVEEWLRLVRARVVLDQRDAAQNDLNRALSAFKDDAEKASQIRSLGAELQLLDEALETQ